MSARRAPAGREQARDERLADPARAEDRYPPPVDAMSQELTPPCARLRRADARATIRGSRPGTRPRDQPRTSISPASPCHSSYGASSAAVSAGLEPAARQRRGELHEREVADEPVVVASEPFQRDHAHRPRADRRARARARAERRSPWRVAEPLEVDRSGEPGERRRAELREAEAAQVERRQPTRARLRVRRVVAAGAAGSAARCARARRASISWPHDRPHRGVGDGREPERAVADERARGGAERAGRGRSAVEAARVVVEREHEAGRRERLLVGCADDDPSVGPLARRRDPLAGERRRPESRFAP